jgi:hypothetical protein
MKRSSLNIGSCDGFERHRKEIHISMGGKGAVSAGAGRTVARALIATGIAAALSAPAHASSHREAPGITKTPKVDGTDLYMFRLAAPGAAPVGLGSTGNPVFNVPASMLGIPAVSLPLLSIEGLPLGLQIAGFVGEDASLFAVAAAIRDLLGTAA